MTERITESVVEDAALVWLEASSYAVLQSPDIAGFLGQANLITSSATVTCAC